ncbi:MAG: hypothetical protein JSW46_07560 [Gemmatimonadota bacterium]|nr:MAG: hypothetical protein JSW46_07560 [Gemmatimonadota bacterium]
MREDRSRIENLVAQNDSLERELDEVRITMLEEVYQLKGVVDSLEITRRTEQLSVRKLRTSGETAQKFAEVFSEVAGASNWGVHEIYDEENDIEIEYISIPSMFIETFIIDHQNAKSLLEQRSTLQSIVQLQDSVLVLSDSMQALELANRTAYREGYEAAFGIYEKTVDDYVAELKKPAFDVDLGSVGLLVGSFAIGVLVGGL